MTPATRSRLYVVDSDMQHILWHTVLLDSEYGATPALLKGQMGRIARGLEPNAEMTARWKNLQLFTLSRKVLLTCMSRWLFV